jgi:phosphatidylglycerophosphate synthase
MISFIRPRLRRPAALVLAGAAMAVAWAVRGGPSWWFSILVAVATIIAATRIYMRSAQDTDFGALEGSRADERLRSLTMQSRALAGTIGLIASFLGLTAAIAARSGWWLPFLVMFAVMGFGYLLGLSNYGVGATEDADDADEARASARR